MITQLSEDMQNVLNGLIFEGIVVVMFIVMLILTLNQYRKRKNDLTKLLLLIFFFYAIASTFSWSAKLVYWTFNVTDLVDIDSNLSYYWLIRLILKYRISFASIAIAAYINYIFKVKVFQKEPNKGERIFMLIFSIVTATFSVFVITDNSIPDLIAFFLMFLATLIIYVPIIRNSFKLAQRIEEPKYRSALFSIGFMGFFFIMIGISMVLDRVMIIFFGSGGYTVFYYFGWTAAILGTIAAYLGFIRPSQGKE
jgi:hypothetical protein